MSAYIVEDKTVNRIITALDATGEIARDRRRILQAVNVSPNDPNWEAKLGAAMASLNDAAIDARYGEGTSQSDRMAPYQWKRTARDTWAQVHKSLGCFLYQCAEGDCDTKPLYKTLEQWQANIAHHIVNDSPEYEKAEWA